jgi:hypothetical protein
VEIVDITEDVGQSELDRLKALYDGLSDTERRFIAGEWAKRSAPGNMRKRIHFSILAALLVAILIFWVKGLVEEHYREPLYELDYVRAFSVGNEAVRAVLNDAEKDYREYVRGHRLPR